jgi:quercetin dioxygenase-like cupin family protein
MAADKTSKAHAPGETTGSPKRAPQHLAETLQVFDLQAELAQARLERGYREGERSANTLVKGGNLRIVHMVLRAGNRLQEHEAAGWISIQSVAGRLRVHAAGQTADLPSGHLLALAGGIRHDVEALEDSAFLLTIAAGPS